MSVASACSGRPESSRLRDTAPLTPGACPAVSGAPDDPVFLTHPKRRNQGRQAETSMAIHRSKGPHLHIMTTSASTPTFTVFTATFNRAQTLPRVYASLAAQTFRDFEWLIVDDGSTDETEYVVKPWIETANFPIRYVTKPNGGKHTAWNVGLSEARGSLFLSLDSDDACTPDALQVFHDVWEGIPVERRDEFVGGCSLVMNSQLEVIGDRFPQDVFDATSDALRFEHHVGGEKWGFLRTEVARQFPFPEIEGVRYVPESIVWGRIASRYKERYVNRALRIYYDDGGKRLSVPSWQDSYVYALADHVALQEKAPRWFRHDPAFFLKAAANFSRYSWHISTSVRAQGRSLRGVLPRLLWAMMLPTGLALYLRDRLRLRVAARQG